MVLKVRLTFVQTELMMVRGRVEGSLSRGKLSILLRQPRGGVVADVTLSAVFNRFTDIFYFLAIKIQEINLCKIVELAVEYQ